MTIKLGDDRRWTIWGKQCWPRFQRNFSKGKQYAHFKNNFDKSIKRLLQTLSRIWKQKLLNLKNSPMLPSFGNQVKVKKQRSNIWPRRAINCSHCWLHACADACPCDRTHQTTETGGMSVVPILEGTLWTTPSNLKKRLMDLNRGKGYQVAESYDLTFCQDSEKRSCTF